MIELKVEVLVKAPVEFCFDLHRSIVDHAKSVRHTRERVLESSSPDLLGFGDTITFAAKHFGFWWKLTSKIVEFDRPNRFVDEMQKGPFKSMRHEHRFRVEDGKTRMADLIVLQAPFGPLGILAETLFIRGHMARFLKLRADYLKTCAEERASNL